jgi:hypothetical protein
MKRRGVGLLTVSGVLATAFVALAFLSGGSTVECSKPGERCLIRSVQSFDEPFLWLLPLGAGFSLAAGLFFIGLERTAPPERATDATWEEFAPDPGFNL